MALGVNNVIASGTRLSGEIRVSGSLRIEGSFEGLIYGDTGRIYVAKTGQVFSDINSEQVVIGGRVTGNVYAVGNVKILKTGRLKGNVYTSSLSTDEGAVFEGTCNIIKKNADRK